MHLFEGGRGRVGIRGSVVAFVMTFVGCNELQPETGDLRPACVDADSDPRTTVDFVRDIRPLMNGDRPGTKGCKSCHYASTGTQEGLIATGLDLQKLQNIRKGARSGPVVVPFQPCKSAVVQKLQGTVGGARMPKDGPYWEPAQIQLVIDWIAEGAQGGDEP